MEYLHGYIFPKSALGNWVHIAIEFLFFQTLGDILASVKIKTLNRGPYQNNNLQIGAFHTAAMIRT